MEAVQLTERRLQQPEGQFQMVSQEIDEKQEGKSEPKQAGKKDVRKWMKGIGLLLLVLVGLFALQMLSPQTKYTSEEQLSTKETSMANASRNGKEDSRLNINNQREASIQLKTDGSQTVNKISGQIKTAPKTKGGSKFSRIIWVQTDHELQAKPMEEAMVAQNLIHFAKKDGFEVRIVNNINAYDWLPEKTIAEIKEAHQKSKVQFPIYELLRLALLFEHGGVSIRLPKILLTGGLGWVEDLMQGGASLEDEERKALSCQFPGPEMIVFHQRREDGRFWYRDDFIVAKPKARLLKMLLIVVQKVIKDGLWPYPNFPLTNVDKASKVKKFPDLTENLINIFYRQDSNLCYNYALQSFHANDGIFMSTIPDSLVSPTLKLSQQDFNSKYGKKYLLRLNVHQIVNDIVHFMKTGSNVGDGGSLLKTKLMMVDGNKWLATPSRKTRDVQLCIVSLAPLPAQGYEQQIKEQVDRLSKQTFANWNLVSFVEGLATVSQKAGDRAVLVNASIYEGLNLQRAATKYCDPASVMFLLDHNETLTTEKDLQSLASRFKPIGVFTAFVKLKNGKNVLKPSAASRGEVQRAVNKPNADLLSDISNFMRAFTVQAYRFIAAVDLHHSSGRYFDRETPLLSVLQLGEHFSPCEKGNIAYQVRRVQRLMAIPRQKLFTSITITTNRFKTADLTRHEYYAKFRHHDLCDAIVFSQRNYAAVEKIVVLNNGREELGLSSRKGMPEVIPRKIHQIWLRGDIPAFKQFLMKRLRDAHPDYGYFLWTEANFTQENFPESYELIQTLLSFDKKSPYSKFGMIADIVRNEVVFRHGGFYVDTNYVLYGERPLDQFLSYSFTSVGEVSPKQRVFKNQPFFSCAKNCSRLARIVSHRALSSRNQYSSNVALQTGPALFSKAQQGEEELDQDTFQASFEEFKPSFFWDFPYMNSNKCTTPNTTPDSEVLFRSPSRSYLKNCSQIYHYALGMEFWDEGLTWGYRRWW